MAQAIWWPSLEEAIAAQQAIVSRTGEPLSFVGGSSVRLEAALALPWQTFDGRDLYPDLIDKVAALIFYIIQGHPFLNANKRTALSLGHAVLVRNGYILRPTVTSMDWVRIALGVAKHQLDIAELSTWLQGHFDLAAAGP